MLTVLAFYFGNRFGQVFDFNTMEITDGALATVNSIVAAPAAISMASVPMLYAIGLAITVLIVWLYTFMYAGNYRYGEEAGSAKWGTLKEGVAFKDQTDPSNNLLFTKNYGLALKKPKFDLEHDRNLNVMVIGGSGSGKTRNYVKPNLMQLNASYFLTDPKGTSLPECGYLFRDNGYRIKVFNTIEFNKSMHYNPLKYVKTDADILSFVNCLISNTNGDKQSGGDPFWENSERLLYTALIALLRDWFPPEDYSLDGLLTLLSMAEAKENDENFKSPLDMIFDEIETGKVYERNPFYQGPSTSSSYADAESDRMAISENTTDEFTWQSSLMERNNDGLSPAREGGLTSDQDFALANYKMFKVAAGKTLKSIIISCNVRMAPMRIEQVRELLKYDEMNLDEMGDPGQRTAVFAIMSDTDKTFSFLHAIMMWQSIDILCRRALEKYNGKLPTMVNFIFDEFANIGTIPDIEQTIAVTRSRNIGISIILQSVAQLESRYDKKAKTIIDCCDTTLFLGGKSNSTNKEISEMIGKQTINQKTFGETRGQSGCESLLERKAIMELILAEKPSAARNFAKALGGKTGNYAGTEYKITNLRGHVMGLLPPDKQVPTEKVEFYKSWDLENLPWNLNDFAWKKGILSGCKDIISGLKDELKEADCVVIATDVDPSGEGELLAWEALEKCGWRGTTRAGRNVSIPTAVLRMTRSCAVRMMHPVAREPSSVSRYSPSRSRAVPSWHESLPRTIRLSRKAPIRVAISRHRRCSRSTSMTRRGSMGTR